MHRAREANGSDPDVPGGTEGETKSTKNTHALNLKYGTTSGH